MTGFGSSEVQSESWRSMVELRSVNQRFLDIRLKLPSGFQVHEKKYREKIKIFCLRGKVDCTIKIEPLSGENGWSIDEERLNAINGLIGKIKNKSGHSLPLQLRDLLQLNVIQNQTQDMLPETCEVMVDKCLDLALKEFRTMKSMEGNALCKDLTERLESCKKMVSELETESMDQGKVYFEKLQQRACELLEQVELQPERLNQELALLCDRYDVSEELLRLKTHLSHLEKLLLEMEVGKKGEFMLQEILREVNTLSSKSNHARISRIAVDFKNELEKMREQLLNLE